MTKSVTSEKGQVVFQFACGKSVQPETGFGVPIHIQSLFILINVDSYTPLALDTVLYINYIALAIDPFLGSCSSFPVVEHSPQNMTFELLGLVVRNGVGVAFCSELLVSDGWQQF